MRCVCALRLRRVRVEYSVCTLSSRRNCILCAEVDERAEVHERPEVVKRAEADARVVVHADGGCWISRSEFAEV